jgi:hypothetical protein
MPAIREAIISVVNSSNDAVKSLNFKILIIYLIRFKRNLKVPK